MTDRIVTLILDQDVLDRYYKCYFKMHPKARKKPIDKPYHPSVNVWCILQRIMMNQLKQKWKDFIVWWINDIGYNGMDLSNFVITFTNYMPTKRRADPDNYTPKFIMDGFVESGFIKDDSYESVRFLGLRCGYDKGNPRTEIKIVKLKENKE